jgi:hypothetical protein
MGRMSTSWRHATLVIALGVWAGCQDEGSGPRMDSESHFLSRCLGPSDCPGELACVCGLCTQACGPHEPACATSVPTSCAPPDLPPTQALCLGTASPPTGMCLPECGAPSDCTAIRPNLLCQRGYCVPAEEGDVSGDGATDASEELDAGTDGPEPDDVAPDEVTDDTGPLDAISDRPPDGAADNDGGAGAGLTGQDCSGSDECADGLPCTDLFGLCGTLCSASDVTCPESMVCELVAEGTSGLCLPVCLQCGSSEGCSGGTICGVARNAGAVLACLPESWAPPELCVGQSCTAICGPQTCGATESGCHCGSCVEGSACVGGRCLALGACAGTPCTDAWGDAICAGQHSYRRCPTNEDAYQLCLCTGDESGFQDDNCAPICVTL